MRGIVAVVAGLPLLFPGAAAGQGTKPGRPGAVAQGDEVGGARVTAAGAATSRTLADRFADVVNVKDFGAKGSWKPADASANDAAFAAAIAAARAAGHGRIYVPGGNYVISKQIDVPLGINAIEGEGRYSTYISWKPGTPGAGAAMFRIQQKNFRLAHMRIAGDPGVADGSPAYAVWMYPTAEHMSQNVRFEDVTIGEHCNVGIYASKPPGGAQQELTTITQSLIDGYAAAIRLDQDHIDLWTIDRSYVHHSMPGGASIDFTASSAAIGFTLDHVWLTGGSGKDSAGIRFGGGLVDLVMKDSGPEGPAWGIDAVGRNSYTVKATGKGAGPGPIRTRNASTVLNLVTAGTDPAGGTVARPGSQPFIDAGDGTGVSWTSIRDTLYETASGGRIEHDPRIWYSFAVKKAGSAYVVFDYDHAYAEGLPKPVSIGGRDLGGGSLSWAGIPLTVGALAAGTDLTRWQDASGKDLLAIGPGGDLRHATASLAISPYAANAGGGFVVTPSGTATSSHSAWYAGSAVRSAPYLDIGHYGSEARIVVGANGGGAMRDLSIQAGGAERVRVTATGFTIGGGAQISASHRATATLGTAAVAPGTTATQQIAVPGAVSGAEVAVGGPPTLEAGLMLYGYVSAANTVTLRVANVSGRTIAPAGGQAVSVRVFNP